MLAMIISGPTVAMAAAALLCIFLVYAHNRFVRDRNRVREAWSGIDVQLKRRYTVVPALVETVAGYATHERSVFESVARTRALSEAAADVKEKQAGERDFSLALKDLFAVAERYPDLQASAGFLKLQDELVSIEDQLQMARRYYNGTVRNYNIRIESFPGNILSSIFGFRTAEFFELDSMTERQAPRVEVEQ